MKTEEMQKIITRCEPEKYRELKILLAWDERTLQELVMEALDEYIEKTRRAYDRSRKEKAA